MAITSYISFISLTYCLLILSMCQVNLSLALGLYQYKNYPFAIQKHDGRSALFNEYFRQHYPLNQQQESSYNPIILSDNKEISNIGKEPITRLNWFKRDVRLPSQSNKRMLCFFHAVNCFG